VQVACSRVQDISIRNQTKYTVSCTMVVSRFRYGIVWLHPEQLHSNQTCHTISHRYGGLSTWWRQLCDGY